jgi:hypothetical protein
LLSKVSNLVFICGSVNKISTISSGMVDLDTKAQGARLKSGPERFTVQIEVELGLTEQVVDDAP